MVVPWLEDLVRRSHDALLVLPPDHPARALLTARGVPDALLTPYHVGWLPNPHDISTCSPAFWKWVQRYGWDRIVFPLTNPLGQVTGLQVRSITDRSYQDFFGVPKEVCPMVFGLHTALPGTFKHGRVVLVEGIFDFFAVRAHTPDVVAALTANASLVTRRLLARYASHVVCLFDMDAPGRRGAYRLAGLPVPREYMNAKDVTSRQTPVPPYQVTLPVYSEHDPNDLYRAGKHDELRRLAMYGVADVRIA